jgi:RNA methyltransferase, TrmH family
LVIASPANERVKYVRSLYRERVRSREKRFIIEGVRLVEEALLAGVRPVLAFYTQRLLSSERGSALLAQLQQDAHVVVEAAEPVMAALADTVTPQGVLAVVPEPQLPWPEHGLLLVLDGLRDPGNAGTILRTAWAAGLSGVAATAGTADLYAPKVVRAAMGAHFHLALKQSLDAVALQQLLHGRGVFLADGQGTPYWLADWRGDRALVIGGEARGSELAAAFAGERVNVPMVPGVESLNAAIAAAVLLFEARRQNL